MSARQPEKAAPRWTEAELRNAKELILLLATIDARNKSGGKRHEKQHGQGRTQ